MLLSTSASTTPLVPSTRGILLTKITMTSMLAIMTHSWEITETILSKNSILLKHRGKTKKGIHPNLLKITLLKTSKYSRSRPVN